jgi:hypothetical protein
MVGEAHNVARPVNETTVSEGRVSTARSIDGYETRADVPAEFVPTSSDKSTAWKAVEEEDDRMGGIVRAIGCEAKSAPVRQAELLAFIGSELELRRIRRR